VRKPDATPGLTLPLQWLWSLSYGGCIADTPSMARLAVQPLDHPSLHPPDPLTRLSWLPETPPPQPTEVHHIAPRSPVRAQHLAVQRNRGPIPCRAAGRLLRARPAVLHREFEFRRLPLLRRRAASFVTCVLLNFGLSRVVILAGIGGHEAEGGEILRSPG
jgi:hypothetical protein